MADSLQVPAKLKKYTPDTSTSNWKSQQYMPGIATEVESEYMEKLYQKFKESDTMKGSLQSAISSLSKDHVSEKQKLNDSFNAMISILEKRRNLLLKNMNGKVEKYRNSLNVQLTQVSANRKELSETKKQYETNVNNKDLTDIEQREKDNIQMISEALNKCKIQNKLKPKHPTFVINQTDANNTLDNIGQFILKTETPHSPTVHLLIRTSENAFIEVLMDESYNEESVSKYELDIYKGPLEEKEYENVKENEYLKVYCNVVRENNIAFHKIIDLDDNEWYNIRLRAVMKEGGTLGKFSQWLSFKTKPLGSDDEDNKDETAVAYTAEDEQKLEQAWNRNMENEALKNREIKEFEAWLAIFKRTELGLSVYEQKRLFFCMQQIENGPGSPIDSADFANFVLSVGQRFDSKEWRNMCKTIRERVLKK